MHRGAARFSCMCAHARRVCAHAPEFLPHKSSPISAATPSFMRRDCLRIPSTSLCQRYRCAPSSSWCLWRAELGRVRHGRQLQKRPPRLLRRSRLARSRTARSRCWSAASSWCGAYFSVLPGHCVSGVGGACPAAAHVRRRALADRLPWAAGRQSQQRCGDEQAPRWREVLQQHDPTSLSYCRSATNGAPIAQRA